MTTQVEYALLAANSYAVKDTVTSIENTIPVPEGWVELDDRINNASGFTARAYQNTQTGEICIAYTGTTFEGNTFDKTKDWLAGNLLAGSGLTLAPQVTDAAKFYLDILQANPGANITFTGHSLGGGLASLMSVYFDEPATVFDEAPFEKSADSAVVVNALKLVLAKDYTLPDAFSGYIALDPLTGAFLPSPSRLARESNVSAVYLKDEILSLAQTLTGQAILTALSLTNPALMLLLLNDNSIYGGTPLAIDAHAVNSDDWGWPGLNGNPVDLHYMPLLTAFLQSTQFLTACQNNPEVLQKIFTSKWNVNPKDPDRRNFLNLMVQRQQVDGEDPLGAFAADIGRIKGELAAGIMKSVLVELGIDLEYAQGLEHASGIASGVFDPVFKPLTGGIQIEHKPEDGQWVAKGFAQLDRELRNAHPELFALSIDRYSLATEGDFVVTAPSDGKKDLMLGGAGGDTLEGGDGNDLLIGGAGDDTLDGGAGYDSYIIEGNDTIRDADGKGILKDKAGNVISGVIIKNTDGSYTFQSDPAISVTLDTDLTLTLADGTVAVIENFQRGDLGLQLADTATQTTPTLTITGDIIPDDIDPSKAGIQALADTNGNPIGQAGAYEDILTGTAGDDHIMSGELNDDVGGGAGNDHIEAGSGADYVNGDAGDDLIEGNAGADILAGDAGNDRIYANTQTDTATAIASGSTDIATNLKGDWLSGNAGDDILIAGADNDVLAGGGGNDLLIAGAGDDHILGDSDYTAQALLEASPRYQIGSTGWYHTSRAPFEWSITPQADSTVFAPVTGATNPPDFGNDVIYAGDGADKVWAGDGNDVVYGEGGDDTLTGEAGNDILMGGAGDGRMRRRTRAANISSLAANDDAANAWRVAA
jgi:Ca2+-binding RTX toxin-like protein